MKFISWLHLSDLHAGTPDHKRLWKNVLGKLRIDLPKVLKRTQSLDLVFFTGDLSYHGSCIDFKIVDNALQDLWDVFNDLGQNPVLVAVPGNHDLQWPSPKKSPSDVRSLRYWHSEPELREEFRSLEKRYSCQKLIEEVFTPFSDWYTGWQKSHEDQCYDSIQLGLIPGDFTMTFEKNGVRLGLVGLNSAFLQLEEGDYKGKLDLDLSQLNTVCNGDPGKWRDKHHCAILLTHHPSDWLKEEREKAFYKEIAQPERFLIHLYGHMHQNTVEYIRVSGQKTIRMAQGTALFSPEADNGEEKRIHGYSGGRLNIEIENKSGQLRIWPRIVKFPIAVKSGYYLAPDWDNFELDEDDAFTTDVEIDLPKNTPIAKLLSECLNLPLQHPRLEDELRECSKIAESSGLLDIYVAQIRIEMYLLSPSSKKLQGDKLLWECIKDIAVRIKTGDTELYIEIQTGFELERIKDGICSYFTALKGMDVNIVECRFLIPIKINEGFLAPIHLLTGLLGRFDWITILNAFNLSVSDVALPSWQALQGFIFDCWLLWGPSIPICNCELWASPEISALMLQYGYGDENNSLPVWLTTEQLPELKALVWGSGSSNPKEGWQPGLARRVTLIGKLISVDDVGRSLPSAQQAVLEGGKYNYVLEYRNAVSPSVLSRGEYYSAYIWIMFEVECDLSSSSLSHRWLRLLPFFEHTNIADASAYDFMKEQLARKAISFISHYRDKSTKFRYACSFDDPGHVPSNSYTTLHTFARNTIRQTIIELLFTDEFSHIRNFVDMEPVQPILTACQLPKLVDEFFDHIKKLGLVNEYTK